MSDAKGRSWGGVLRLGLAVTLFAVVLWFVPWRDSVTWAEVIPESPVVGTLEQEPGVWRVEGDGISVTLYAAEDATSDEPTGGDAPTSLYRRVDVRRGDDLETLTPGGDLGSPSLEQGLLTTLRELDPVPYGAALLCYLVAASLSFLRWHLLLGAVGIDAQRMRAVRLGFYGLFFNNVLPGATGGDLVKAVFIARDHPDRRPAAVLSIFVDRLIGLFGLALLTAVLLLFHLDRYPRIAMVVGGLVVALSMGAVAVLSRPLRRVLRIETWLPKLPGGRVLVEVDRALLRYRNQPRVLIVALLMSLGVHGSILTGIGLVGTALALPIDSFSAYYALSPLPLIVQAVPIFPAGLGVGETAFVYFFSREAGLVSDQAALALALSYRALQVFASLVGGVLLLTDRDRRTIVRTAGAGEAEPAPDENVARI